MQMTSQSPRIYTYKITFEEVPYYYYGVHKERRFNEYYMGSPKTHKWCWEFYTPKKQILELFDYDNEGWLKAQEIEKQLIKPFYNTDKWCLNENCGGIISLEISSGVGKQLYVEKKGVHGLSKEEKREIGKNTHMMGIGVHGLTREERSEAGKIGGRTSYERGAGIHALTKEQRVENSKKSGKIAGHKNYDSKVGIHARTEDQITKDSRKGGQRSYQLGVGVHGRTKEEMRDQGRENGKKLHEEKKGIHSRTKEQMSEHSKRVSKMLNSQRWQCTITGHISTPGALTTFQRNRNIDTSNRIRIK